MFDRRTSLAPVGVVRPVTAGLGTRPCVDRAGEERSRQRLRQARAPVIDEVDGVGIADTRRQASDLLREFVASRQPLHQRRKPRQIRADRRVREEDVERGRLNAGRLHKSGDDTRACDDRTADAHRHAGAIVEDCVRCHPHIRRCGRQTERSRANVAQEYLADRVVETRDTVLLDWQARNRRNAAPRDVAVIDLAHELIVLGAVRPVGNRALDLDPWPGKEEAVRLLRKVCVEFLGVMHKQHFVADNGSRRGDDAVRPDRLFRRRNRHADANVRVDVVVTRRRRPARTGRSLLVRRTIALAEQTGHLARARKANEIVILVVPARVIGNRAADDRVWLRRDVRKRPRQVDRVRLVEHIASVDVLPAARSRFEVGACAFEERTRLHHEAQRPTAQPAPHRKARDRHVEGRHVARDVADLLDVRPAIRRRALVNFIPTGVKRRRLRRRVERQVKRRDDPPHLVHACGHCPNRLRRLGNSHTDCKHGRTYGQLDLFAVRISRMRLSIGCFSRFHGFLPFLDCYGMFKRTV